MKNIVKTSILMLLFILQGCGDSSEPPILVEKSTELKKEVVLEEKKEVVQTEQNITVTHIRVLELDVKSQIPEYLIKIPIYQNQK